MILKQLPKCILIDFEINFRIGKERKKCVRAGKPIVLV